MLPSTQRLGKYELRREIGQGGFGRVYEAYDPAVGRRVAIKVLSTGADPAMLRRFQTEAGTTGRLQHKNIVTIYDFDEHEGQPFIVMEFLEGDDLQQIIQIARPLTLFEKVRIMTEVAEGLQYAHAKGFVHRDVKPGNIKVQPDGAVKIMDFGIARFLRDNTRHTQEGYVIGTVSYLAPEQFTGADSGSRGDIFAYGAVYYELLSGKHPFAAADTAKVMFNIINTAPEPLSALVPGCPPALETIVALALTKDPALRYQSMVDLLLDSQPLLLSLRTQEAADLIGKARACIDKGALEAAQALLRQALEFDPANSQALELRATIPQREASRRAARALEAKSAGSQGAPGVNPSDPVLDALRARLLGAREKETQHPKPAQAPGEKTPSRPPSQPPVESVADASHTQLFATRPASVSAPPAISDAHTPAPAASESTILFSVPEPGSAPGQPIAGKDEPPIDTALTISNCAEPTFLGSKVGLQRFPFTIGRGDADWKLFFDAAVSARHAEIDYRQGGFFIRDLNSANGTFLNGQRLPPMRPEALLFGARILLGSNTELVFGSGDLREIPDLRGQLVGNRFTLLEKLHSSPKSVLYLARDENLPRQVVVKLLSPSLINHAGYCEQFSREAHTASLLRHAHICQVIDYGELRLADGSRSLYVCMEYLPGGSLQARLHQSGSIPVDRIALWLEAVCQALSYIHERGVVHAGIKPSAIVFDDSDNACLTDFAFATQLGEGNRHTVIGAPAFLAPEQWDGADLVPATDQYALAVLFYWLTAGALPFEGQEHSAVRLRNLQREPDPVHQMAARNGRPAVPPALSPVFQRALAVRSDQRFPNARDFAAAFRLALIEPAPVRSGPPSVFISYQRAASSAWAVLLKKEMEREQGFQVFLDTEQQDSTGQFPLKLRRRIQECDVFICLLAESTLASDWVRQEIQLASDAAKPMIPVFQESYRDPPNLRTLEPYVQELLTYEGVKLLDRQNIYLDAAIQALIVSTRRTIETAGLRAGTPRPHQAEAAPQKRRAGFARRLRKQLQALIRRLSGE